LSCDFHCLINRATQQATFTYHHTHNSRLGHNNTTAYHFDHHGYSNAVPASKPIIRVQATKPNLRNQYTTRTRRIACAAQPPISHCDTHLREDAQ
jgi:hypothetical protein